MKKENTELQIIDSAEFGIEPKKAKEITSGLTTILAERQVLEESYQEVLKLEITPENLPQFKALRLKIRDNRTKGIDQWHKVNKDFYLKGGQFVDAIKRKESLVNEQMEDKLLEAEKYFENLEKERLAKLNEERKEAIRPYVGDLGHTDFSNMPDDVWQPYFESKKKAYEDKIEAERLEAERLENERVEKEKAVKLHNERKELLIDVWNFVPLDKRNDDFSLLTEDEFNERLEYSRKLYLEDFERKESIRLENERLKKEAEAKEELVKKRSELLQPYIIFIRDYNGLISKEEIDFNKEFEEIKKGAEEHWKYEAEQRNKAAVAEMEKEKEMKRLKEEKEKADAELKLKQEAEEKLESERLEKEKQAKIEADKLAKAPDKDRLIKMLDDTNLIVSSFDFKTKEAEQCETLIIDKFNAFKSWAKLEIEKL